MTGGTYVLVVSAPGAIAASIHSWSQQEDRGRNQPRLLARSWVVGISGLRRVRPLPAKATDRPFEAVGQMGERRVGSQSGVSPRCKYVLFAVARGSDGIWHRVRFPGFLAAGGAGSPMI